jgi:hypothetical protein
MQDSGGQEESKSYAPLDPYPFDVCSLSLGTE